MLGFRFTLWRNLYASLLYFVVSVQCRRQKKFTFTISSADELLVLLDDYAGNKEVRNCSSQIY